MDNVIKLILVLLVFYTSQSFAVFESIVMNDFGDVVTTTRMSNGRRIVAYATAPITSNQFKTLKGFPTTATFNAPVPVSTTAKVSRGLSLTKPVLGTVVGGLAKLLTPTPAGAAIQLGLLAAGYLITEYALDDPDIIEGEFKVVKPHEQTAVTYGDYIDYSSECSGGQACSITRSTYYNNTSPYNTDHHYESCVPYSDYPSNYSICRALKSESDTIVYLPATEDDFHDDFIDSMTDQQFEDFIAQPAVEDAINETQPAQDLVNDLNNDLQSATDKYSSGNPNTSTEPTTTNADDTNLDGITVPEYDDVPISTSEIQATPEYNTIIDTVTSTTVDTVNYTETKTIVTTTTVVNSETGEVESTSTTTRRNIYPRPDLNPNNNPDPNAPTPDPNSPNPDPNASPTTTTTTTPNSGNPNAPQKVEVVNQPAPAKSCDDYPNALGCLNVGNDLPETPEVETYEVPFEVEQFVLANNAECPAPVTFTLSPFLGGKTYELTYQPVCDFATAISVIIIGIGLLLSFYIVSGSVKQGAV
ncbi:MAG: virulence factor TspB C-terminal domain-related protein [Cocleimonas sp.]